MIEPLFWLAPLAPWWRWGSPGCFSAICAGRTAAANRCAHRPHVRAGAMAYLRQQYRVMLAGIRGAGGCVRAAGLRLRGADHLAALHLPVRRFLLGAGGVLRHADRDPGLDPHCRRGAHFPGRQPAGGLSQRRRDRPGGGGPGAGQLRRLVAAGGLVDPGLGQTATGWYW